MINLPNVALTVSFLGVLIFAFGALIGHSLTEQAFDRRNRRQATTQRWLNQQFEELEARQQADALLRATRQQPETDADDERPSRPLSA